VELISILSRDSEGNTKRDEIRNFISPNRELTKHIQELLIATQDDPLNNLQEKVYIVDIGEILSAEQLLLELEEKAYWLEKRVVNYE